MCAEVGARQGNRAGQPRVGGAEGRMQAFPSSYQ